MDYQKHHDKIIATAKSRILEGYIERHHIIPKCLGGTDDPSNIVELTPEEHYVIHQLLVKMHPGNDDLALAVNLMSGSGMPNRNNRSYGWIRRKVSEARRGKKQTKEHRMKNSIANRGKNNAMYGKKHTAEALKKMRGPKSESAKKKSSATNIDS